MSRTATAAAAVFALSSLLVWQQQQQTCLAAITHYHMVNAYHKYGYCPMADFELEPSEVMTTEEDIDQDGNAPRAATAAFAASPEQKQHLAGIDLSSCQNYFRYYAKLGSQQNMLQDSARTGTYFKAIVANGPAVFQDKVVMDIGAGSGVLSFFSAMAGAARVFAVEGSNMATTTAALAATNEHRWRGGRTEPVVRVVNKLLEDIDPEKDEIPPNSVDVLVSEPIGTFLFNERMIETYLKARDRFLKPGGKMFPNRCTLFLAPFSDATLWWEVTNQKVAGADSFWAQDSFFGMDLNAARDMARTEVLRAPIVDYIDPQSIVGDAQSVEFDMHTVKTEDLADMSIKFTAEIRQTALVHGLAGWFDAHFDDEGCPVPVTLSTHPTAPRTHWYQIRFLATEPLAVNRGDRISGVLRMVANDQQSYHMTFNMTSEASNTTRYSTVMDLKEPEYRFFSSQSSFQPPMAPPNQDYIDEVQRLLSTQKVSSSHTTEL